MCVSFDTTIRSITGPSTEAIILNPYLNGEVIRLDGATRLSAQMQMPRGAR